MIGNFEKSLEQVLLHEGGKVDLKSDPGGRTNAGITQRTYDAYRDATHADRRDVYLMLSLERDAIYRQRYWNVIRGDDLPLGIDAAVFDWAVNSGPARAAIALQRILGVADDGVIGPITLAAAAKGNPKFLIKQLCSVRLTFLQRLSTWPTFGRGWTKRVRAVEAEALRMVETPVVPRVPRLVEVELVGPDDDIPLIFPVAADELE